MTTPGCQLNEEEKSDQIKESFHLERTKFSRDRETRNNKWPEMVRSHLKVGQDVSLCNILRRGGWGREILAEDDTREVQSDQLVSFMRKTREFSSSPESRVLS